MSESTETRKFCRELEAAGAMTYAAVGNMRSQSGWPDRFVQHAFWNGWLEMKIDANKLTPLQREIGLQLEKRSVRGFCNYFVVRFFSKSKLMQIERADGGVLFLTDKRGLDFLEELSLWAG